MRNAYSFIFLCFALAAAGAQENTGGIIYGDDWAYIVQAPEGWIMDSQVWSGRGIYGLFYRAGMVPQVPNPIIYINSVKLKNSSAGELRDFIVADLGPYIADPGTTIDELAVFRHQSGQNVRIFSIRIGNRQFELIGYYQQKDTVHMVVLAVFYEEDLALNADSFYSVLASISPMDKREVPPQ